MKESLKLAWLTPYLGRGGKLMYMKPILTELAKDFKSLHVFTPDAGFEIEKTEFPIELAGKLKQIYYQGKDGYAKGVAYVSLGFIKTVYSYKPDILVINEFSLISLYGVILHKAIKNSRMVLLVESKPLENDSPILKKIKFYFRKFIVSNVDMVITNNKLGLGFLTNELKVDLKKIIVKPYLVSQLANDASFQSSNQWISNMKPTDHVDFIFVGNLIERKGLKYAIVAFAELVAKGVTDFKFHIVGDGSIREELESLVKSHKLEDRIIFYGSKNYDQLHEYYTKAHVFVFSSLRDYRALVPFEALSFGLPLIDSIHNGGSAETIIDGKNGYVIDPMNKEQFSFTLMKIIREKQKLKEFSESSFKISSSYTLETSVSALLETIDLALK